MGFQDKKRHKWGSCQIQRSIDSTWLNLLFSDWYHLTFVAVVKTIVFRVLFIIKSYYNFDINQMDIKTAFLYEIID